MAVFPQISFVFDISVTLVWSLGLRFNNSHPLSLFQHILKYNQNIIDFAQNYTVKGLHHHVDNLPLCVCIQEVILFPGNSSLTIFVFGFQPPYASMMSSFLGVTLGFQNTVKSTYYTFFHDTNSTLLYTISHTEWVQLLATVSVWVMPSRQSL